MSRRRRASVYKGALGVVRRRLRRQAIEAAEELVNDREFVAEALRFGTRVALDKRRGRRGGG